MASGKCLLGRIVDGSVGDDDQFVRDAGPGELAADDLDVLGDEARAVEDRRDYGEERAALRGRFIGRGGAKNPEWFASMSLSPSSGRLESTTSEVRVAEVTARVVESVVGLPVEFTHHERWGREGRSSLSTWSTLAMKGQTTPSAEAARSFIDASSFIWHQRFELVHGVETPGTHAIDFLFELGGAEELNGKTVLDVGTSNGGAAFLMERWVRLASSRSTFTHLTDSVSMSSSSSLVPTSSTSRGRSTTSIVSLTGSSSTTCSSGGCCTTCAIPCSRSTRFDPCSLRTA